MGVPDWQLEPTCDGWSGYPPEQQARAVKLATAVVWAATGRRFGLLEITVQPHNPHPQPALYQTYPVEWDSLGGGGPLVSLEGGIFYRPADASRCRELPLAGPTTTANVLEVVVDGQPLPQAAYQIHDGHLLVRLDGQCWPALAHPDPNFTVRYRRGEPLPEEVKGAAEVLACEFAKAIAGGKCRLPNRLASLSRQGVEVQVEQVIDSYLDRMLTTLPEVDRVIVAVNPGRLHARPQVFSPDLHPPRMVT